MLEDFGKRPENHKASKKSGVKTGVKNVKKKGGSYRDATFWLIIFLRKLSKFFSLITAWRVVGKSYFLTSPCKRTPHVIWEFLVIEPKVEESTRTIFPNYNRTVASEKVEFRLQLWMRRKALHRRRTPRTQIKANGRIGKKRCCACCHGGLLCGFRKQPARDGGTFSSHKTKLLIWSVTYNHPKSQSQKKSSKRKPKGEGEGVRNSLPSFVRILVILFLRHVMYVVIVCVLFH